MGQKENRKSELDRYTAKSTEKYEAEEAFSDIVHKLSDSQELLQIICTAKLEQEIVTREAAKKYRFWIHWVFGTCALAFYFCLFIVLINIFFSKESFFITDEDNAVFYTLALIILATVPTLLSITFIRYYFKPHR